MWSEMAAATADWSPLMWAGALGGASAGVGAAAELVSRSRRASGLANTAETVYRAQKAFMDQLRETQDRLDATTGKLAASVVDHPKPKPATKVDRNGQPYIRDWCAGCNHLRGRKQMRWTDDGLWVCRWCAKGEVPPEGWCNCPDCQVFGQNAAHLPAHDVHLGPLAQAATEKAASATADLQDQLEACWTAGDDYKPHRLIPLLASVPPSRVSPEPPGAWKARLFECNGARGNHGDGSVVCANCADTTFHPFLGDAKADLRARGAGSIHKVGGGYEVRS